MFAARPLGFARGDKRVMLGVTRGALSVSGWNDKGGKESESDNTAEGMPGVRGRRPRSSPAVHPKVPESRMSLFLLKGLLPSGTNALALVIGYTEGCDGGSVCSWAERNGQDELLCSGDHRCAAGAVGADAALSRPGTGDLPGGAGDPGG